MGDLLPYHIYVSLLRFHRICSGQGYQNFQLWKFDLQVGDFLEQVQSVLRRNVGSERFYFKVLGDLGVLVDQMCTLIQSGFQLFRANF